MDNNNNNRNGNNQNQNQKKPSPMMILLTVLITILMLSACWSMFMGDSTDNDVTYSQFVSDLEAGKIEAIEISNGVVKYELKETGDEKPVNPFAFYGSKTPKIYHTLLIEDYDTVTQRAIEKGVDINGVSTSTMNTIMMMLIALES